MLRTIVFTVIALALVLAGCLRWRSWMKTPRDETRYLAIALLAFGMAFVLNVPPVATTLDRDIWRLADGAILASHMLGLVTAWGGIELCAEVAGYGTRRRRERRAVFAVVAAGMLIAFLIAEPLAETPLLFEHYAHATELRPYWVIFVSAITAATAYLAYIALRHTQHNDRWLRRGLRLIGIGAAMIFLFAASRLAAIWADLPDWVEPAAITILSVGATVLAIGASLPHLAAAGRHHSARRSLYPIWLLVTSSYPHVRASTQPRSLYRLIIEIQDALAEARSRNELESPLMQALNRLPARVGDNLEDAVDDLLHIAATARSSQWAA